MAEDLDRFTLMYQVDLKDSISRLQKLQESMEKTSKGHEKSVAGVKEMVSHFQGVSKTLDTATGAFGKFLGAAGPVAGAMTAIGLAVKFAADQVQEYNANLKLAYGTGIDLTSLEGVRRSLTAGGNVDRATVDQSLGNIAGMVRSARIDPTGADAYKLRMMGGNPFGSVQDNMSSIGANFQGMSREQAEALGMSYGGLDPRMVDELRRAGSDAGKVQMSDEDIANIAQYNENLKTLNETFNKGKSAIKEFSVDASADLINFFKALPEAVGSALSPSKNGGWLAWLKKMGDSAMMADGAGMFDDNNSVAQDTKKALADADQKRQKLVAKAKSDATQQHQIFDAGTMYMRAASLFAASVNSFTHTIGEQEMNALLAGEAGAASGAGGSPSSVNGASNGGGSTFVPGGSGTWQSSQYAQHIKAAADKTGLDPQLIYAVMQTESHGVNGQYSETGAGGLMQVTRGNWKKLGNGSNVMDPAANIMVGAGILKEQIGINKGNLEAGLRGYNGNSDPNYVSKVLAAFGGSAIGTGHWVATPGKSFNLAGGNSLDRQRVLSAADAIAAGMHVSGVTGAGILQGQFSRGDVDLGYQRALTSAKASVYKAYQAAYAPGLNAFQRKSAMTEFQQAAISERSLENYSAQILGRARAGGQELTSGQTVNIDASNISINVTGGIPDQAQFKRRVTQILHESVQQALNEQVDSVKG